MVEWHFELGLFLQMARVAKFRLCFHQQELAGFRMVRGVAGNATDIVSRVDRIDGIHVLSAPGVATQAAIHNRFCGNILKGKDFGDITAAVHVSFAGAVASFATLLRWPTQFVERGFPVRGLLPPSVNICVAGFAGLDPTYPDAPCSSPTVPLEDDLEATAALDSAWAGLWPAAQEIMRSTNRLQKAKILTHLPPFTIFSLSMKALILF